LDKSRFLENGRIKDRLRYGISQGEYLNFINGGEERRMSGLTCDQAFFFCRGEGARARKADGGREKKVKKKKERLISGSVGMGRKVDRRREEEGKGHLTGRSSSKDRKWTLRDSESFSFYPFPLSVPNMKYRLASIITFILFLLALESRLLNRFDVQKYAREAYNMGIRYIGACCGMEPYHVRAIAEEAS